jgi:tetratricopeptide (TPR) repeat protein/tRNA A-37 threonylcarbamoyl transferase component Bud32
MRRPLNVGPMAERSDATDLGSLASVLDGLAETPAPHLEIVAGSLVGERFRVERRLAEGGMGVVYRARDLKLGRDVAIKLHARQSAAASALLLAEAAAQARVSHPNVVTAYEVGEVGGSIFIAMELVEGQTVRAWLAARPRSWREIVRVYLGAAAGVAAVHRAGLVHRDLKPDNILVGADGRARLVDFGLALGTTEGGAEGPVAGTPAYMAPEQRDRGAVDARADQYALCTALAEALARCPAPRWLRRVVERGRAVDPGRRHPDMDALVAALGFERRDRRRARVAVALAAGLCAAGLALGLRHARPTCTIPEDRSPWPAARAAAVERAFLATGLPYAPAAFARVDATLGRYAATWRAQLEQVCAEPSDELAARRLGCAEERAGAARALVDVLAAADRAALDSSAAAVESLPELARCADARYLLARLRPPEGAAAAAVARLRQELDAVTAQYRAGHYQDALRRGLPLVGMGTATGYLPAQAEVNYAVGTVQNYAGAPVQAAASLEGAYFAALRSGHDELAARAAVELIDVTGFELIRFDEAAAWSRHAAAEVARAAPGTGIEADLHTQVALLRERQGAYLEALGRYRQALALRGRLGEGQGVLAARLHTHIGAVLDSLGRPHEAIAAYRASLAARAGVLPALHPDSVNTIALLALAQKEAGLPEAALVTAEAALAIGELTLGRLHPKTALGHIARGAVLRELGAPAAAAADGEEALAIFRATRGPEHPNVAYAEAELGLSYVRLARPEEALDHARRALALYRRTLGAEHPQTAIAAARLGAVLAAAHRCAEALPVLEGAVAVLDRVNRDGDGTSAVLVDLGRCLAAAGRWDEAAAAAQRAAQLCAERGAPAARADEARALLARAEGVR